MWATTLIIINTLSEQCLQRNLMCGSLSLRTSKEPVDVGGAGCADSAAGESVCEDPVEQRSSDGKDRSGLHGHRV